jgi:isopenicillin N synthase-like dioxygenase
MPDDGQQKRPKHAGLLKAIKHSCYECGIFQLFERQITNDARRTREIKSTIAMVKAVFNTKKTFHKQTDRKFKEETSFVQ